MYYTHIHIKDRNLQGVQYIFSQNSMVLVNCKILHSRTTYSRYFKFQLHMEINDKRDKLININFGIYEIYCYMLHTNYLAAF